MEVLISTKTLKMVNLLLLAWMATIRINTKMVSIAEKEYNEIGNYEGDPYGEENEEGEEDKNDGLNALVSSVQLWLTMNWF